MVEGNVSDLTASEAVPYASVYISGTTYGAVTNEKGFFRISKIPADQFDLVVSVIGYKPQTVKVEMKNLSIKQIDFKLERITLEFRQMDVSGEKPNEWLDQLELFKKLLFGQNMFAQYCTITNPQFVNFMENKNKITAECPVPLKIRNDALGYMLECVLKYFEYNKISGSLTYSVFPKFDDIKTNDKDSLENIIYKRKLAFKGSSAHLLASLVSGEYKFRDEGFELKKNSLVVNKANEIVFYDTLSQKYYLKFDGCIRIQYWAAGKRTYSTLCLNYGSTQFSPAGYLIYPGEFRMEGDMAKEGIATMLPRFIDIKDEEK
jgi:hypothetical protein